MINNFNFSQDDKKKTKAYFDAADILLSNAIKNHKLTLKEKINSDGEVDIKWISDAIIIEKTVNKNGDLIEKQRPVIDLVQQGGGMWGIALLGYCYIMEKIGIRFYSHGGTSAGAINALFLSSISADIYKEPPIIETTDNRGALKSEILTLIVSKMDFSSFMNRGGLAGKIQKQLFKNFNSKFLPLILAISSLVIIMGTYFLSGTLLKNFGMGISDIKYFSFVIGTFNIIAFLLLLYILFSKVLGENFGLNTGNPFLFWVKENLGKLNITTTSDLYLNLSKTKLIRNENEDLKPNISKNIKSHTNNDKPIIVSDTRLEQKMSTSNLISKIEHPKIVLITSNLSHNRIVRFPKRANEYWENHMFVHPAAYVRASMSLPFIFKTFIPNNHNHYGKEDPTNKVILKARMVDGGMLSNFPIREFHRGNNKTPSFPTFGVLLSKRKEIESEENLDGQKNSLLNYIMSYVKTFRNFYDNDFMIDNKEIQNRVVTVNTKDINWLDFWMTSDTKKELFVRGAQAAVDQIHKFNWKEYKELRIKMAKNEFG